MTHIEQMIKDMCPHGVEFKKLGDLGVFENTGVDKKSRDDEQEVTLLNFMDVCRHKYIDASVPTMVVTAPDRKIEQCNVLKDDIFITPSSETIDEIGFAAVIMEDLPNVVYSYHIMRYRLNQPYTTTAKYIRYLFEAPVIRKQILKGAKGLTRFGLSKYQFADIEIPIPPLEIQEKIVECLDKFSALAAELQAELQLRRKQYEYYRTQLLTPHSESNSANKTDDCNWEWKTLGEICTKIVSGGTPARNHTEYFEGSIPWMRTQEVDWKDVYDTEIHITDEAVKKSSAKLIPANCVIIAMYGATAGKSCINKIPVTTNQACCNLEIDPKQALYRYVYYWVCKEYENIKGMGEGSQNNINGQKIKSYKIPLPPLAEQERIVTLLDKFESLTNSLTEGIPAEQVAQQKRYEYYRDLLLTFPRKEV